MQYMLNENNDEDKYVASNRTKELCRELKMLITACCPYFEIIL